MYACSYVVCLELFYCFSYLASQCPPGMVSQQCGSLCPQTCRNIDIIDQGLCNSGCAEGCFCPDDQVLVNGVCKHALICPGMESSSKSRHITYFCGCSSKQFV